MVKMWHFIHLYNFLVEYGLFYGQISGPSLQN
jgi:hypothetical protein